MIKELKWRVYFLHLERTHSLKLWSTRFRVLFSLPMSCLFVWFSCFAFASSLPSPPVVPSQLYCLHFDCGSCTGLCCRHRSEGSWLITSLQLSYSRENPGNIQSPIMQCTLANPSALCSNEATMTSIDRALNVLKESVIVSSANSFREHDIHVLQVNYFWRKFINSSSDQNLIF